MVLGDLRGGFFLEAKNFMLPQLFGPGLLQGLARGFDLRRQRR
jgi:hypothetical protein